MTTPDPENLEFAPPEVTQLGLGLAETPQGQRVVLTMTMLLPAADAKAFGEQLVKLAASLSQTRLVVASSLNGGTVSGQ